MEASFLNKMECIKSALMTRKTFCMDLKCIYTSCLAHTKKTSAQFTCDSVLVRSVGSPRLH